MLTCSVWSEIICSLSAIDLSGPEKEHAVLLMTMHSQRHLGLLFVLLLSTTLLPGCGGRETARPDNVAAEAAVVDSVDASCAYFYFLWGSHAEAGQKYEEALEAYQKAAICDPHTEYIAEKIPYLLIQTGRLDEAEVWLEDYIRSRPHKTLQIFILAGLKIQKEKMDEAIALYRQALAHEPENNSARLQLGLLYSKLENFTAAEDIFQVILESDPESYFADLYLARLFLRTGRLDHAENHYLKALGRNWSAELSFEIADFYLLRKKYSEALDIYAAIVSNDGEDERAALGLVQSLLLLDKKEEALQELERIRSFTATPDRIDLVRSQIYINTDELGRARDLLQEILKKDNIAQANFLLGVLYYEEKEYQEALGVLKAIPVTSSEFKDATLLRIRIFEETDRSEQSIRLLQSVIGSEDSRSPFFYSLLSSIYQRQDRLGDAMNTLKEGADIYQEDEKILYDYAVLLEKTDHHDKAFSLMEKILSRNPDHADALNFIGYTMADRNVNLEKAYAYIVKALQLKPESGYILDSLGWVFFRMGEFEKALVELEKAILLEPDDPFIFDHLGDTHRALDNIDKARQYYRKALELFTDEKKKIMIQEKIDALDQN